MDNLTTLEFLDCETAIKQRYPDWQVSRGTTVIQDDIVQFNLYRNCDSNEVFVVMNVKTTEIISSCGRFNFE